MQHASLGSLFALLVLSFGVVTADDKKDDAKNSDKHKHHLHGTISKFDADKHTISIKTTDKDGKEQEKNLQLADDVKLLNAAGKEAKAKSFEAGDPVCLTEKDGKVTKLRKHAEAKITKVDQKAGKITVKMTDENGKSTEKTFTLVEDTEYLDSTGRVAVLDVFRSGDDILFVEADGKIEAIKKDDKSDDKSKSSDKKDKDDKSSSKSK